MAIYDVGDDFLIFVQVALKSVRFDLKRECGIDILRLTTLDDVARYTKLILNEHPNLDPATALMVVSTDLEFEFKRALKKSKSQ